MSRRFLALSAALTSLIVLPASASAATFTVDQAAAPGCAGTTCKTIGAAVAAVADGDTIQVRPAATAFVEDPIVLTKKNVTIQAAPGTAIVTLKNTVPAGSHVITLSGDGDRLDGLVVSVQDNGGNAVRANAIGTSVENSYLTKATSTTQDVPTYEVAAGNKQFLKHTFVIHTPNMTAAGVAAAVQGLADSTLEITDSSILSGANGGSAVRLPGNLAGSPNLIVRSSVQAQKANGAHALHLESAADSASGKLTKIDSSILAGGQNGAGLRAESYEADPPGSAAGPIRIEIVQSTIATSAHAVQLSARANDGGPVLGDGTPKGAIDAVIDRSIVHGQATLENFDAFPLLGTSNTATLTITNSDSGINSSDDTGSTVTVTNSKASSDQALFVDVPGRNLHLRADSPAKDRGGDLVSGESQTDIDGEPRKGGPATDLGADEFHNRSPLARIRASALAVRQNEAITFDASDTFDPERAAGGGSIKEYRWSFGDGTTAATSGPQVSHSYPAQGFYFVSVQVVDNFDAVSTVSEELGILVVDGLAPVVKINAPKTNQRLSRHSTVRKRVKVGNRTRIRRTKRVRQLRFTGSAADDSGVALVALSLKYVSSSQRVSARSAQTTSRTCRYFDAKGRNQVVGRPCTKPIFFQVRMNADGIWAYRTKKTSKLRAGTYELTARAVDRVGVVGTSVVRFRMR